MSNYLYYKSGHAAGVLGAILVVAVGVVAAVLMASVARPCSAAPASSVATEVPSVHAEASVKPESGTRLFVSEDSPSQPSCSDDPLSSAPIRSVRQGDRDASTAPAPVHDPARPLRPHRVGPAVRADRASHPPPRLHLRGIVLQI